MTTHFQISFKSEQTDPQICLFFSRIKLLKIYFLFPKFAPANAANGLLNG